MEQAMSDLAAPGLTAARLSVVAPYGQAEVRAALHKDSFNRAGPGFVWGALLGVRGERWIIDNQDWKAPRVRHRRLP
jgi:hypothetical protein